MGGWKTCKPTVTAGDPKSLRSCLGARGHGGMREDCRLWVAGCSACCHDDGIISLDWFAVETSIAAGVADDSRAHRAQNSVARRRGETLVEWENGIAIVPCALQSVDERRAKGHVQADKFAHIASVRAILER